MHATDPDDDLYYTGARSTDPCDREHARQADLDAADRDAERTAERNRTA